MTATIIGVFAGLLIGNAIAAISDGESDSGRKFFDRTYFQSVALLAVWLTDYFVGGK